MRRLCPFAAGTFLISLIIFLVQPPGLSVRGGDSAEDQIRAISYVESSSGLATPAWEGGRTELEMGDVNADGKADIVSIGDHGNPLIGSGEEGVMVWFGDGRGTWSYSHFGHLGYGGIALGDVNNDGKMDIGYAMHHNYGSADMGDQLIEVALGDGSGQSWLPWDDGLATNGEDYGMFSTDFADIDNDGDLDLGSVSFGCCNGIHVYLNSRDGSWIQSFFASAGEFSNSSMQFYFGDVNSDGNADIATSEEAGTVYLGDGSGGFSHADGNLPPLPPSADRPGVHIGDANDDGCQDVSFVNAQGGVEVWFYNGSGSWIDGSGTLPGTGTYDATQLCDMNMDGKLDVVAFGTGKVTIWSGNGAGGWTQLTEFTLPRNGTHQAIRTGTDADHNGYPDIVLLDEEQISMFNYQNFLRFFKEASSPSSLSINSVYPRGRESFVKGSVRFIDWISAIPSGQSFGTVKLELSTEGSSGPWNVIADNLPNNGRYQWNVSSDKYCSKSCVIRYTVTNSGGSSSAITSAPFQIVPREFEDKILINFLDKENIGWEDYMPACDRNESYNLYRSDWEHFRVTGEYTQDPASVPNAARFCEISASPRADPFIPPSGKLVFYLVSGNKGGVEGSLGRRSGGEERANAHPCP